ncbi:uncharacterized protein At4g08330, chloroplastic-like [Salvia splendens]|uniref:uncharacterized protein At4g08330, chloroplastic-like n=1 Tax=Salvia splendens TaxID=180675 RepID=UPI001C27A4B8|nr:uncharacterized protein At4g08330, chloroplastic-like [Salvia splendens]
MSGGGGGGGDLEAVPPLQLTSSDSYSHVSYSCGSCGYELNLNSCNRNISLIDSEYGKSMKRGVISFFSVDESRFTQGLPELHWHGMECGGWHSFLSVSTGKARLSDLGRDLYS